jgi:hypothetical protein
MKLRAATVVFILVIVGIIRVVSTYTTFCQTFDEPFHIARGMQWLHEGRYEYSEHPPLAPVAFAIGPSLAGVPFTSTGNKFQDGNAILYHGGRYWQLLSLARVGNILFFIVASVAVWGWTQAMYGRATAVVAVALFTTLPLVLGHSGLATTDIAVTAFVAATVALSVWWLRKPSSTRSLVFGFTVGLALLTKFSAVIFLLFMGLAVALLRRAVDPNQRATPRLASISVCVATSILAVWSGYRFSFGPVPPRGHQSFTGSNVRREFPSASETLGARLRGIPVPAPEFFRGILSIADVERKGRAPYFLGTKRHERASLGFFPVLLAARLPAAFLLLTIFGLLAGLRQFLDEGDWRILIPLVIVSAMIIPLMSSNINVGLRHALPVIPFLAGIAGNGATFFWNVARARTLMRTCVVILCSWCAISSAACHPDYLSYFNDFARPHAEDIAVDSDLDWGQDLPRLWHELSKRSIASVSLAYFGTADIRRQFLANVEPLPPWTQKTGWIAISLFWLKTPEGYAWLESQEPVARVGNSMLLFYVPKPTG